MSTSALFVMHLLDHLANIANNVIGFYNKINKTFLRCVNNFDHHCK